MLYQQSFVRPSPQSYRLSRLRIIMIVFMAFIRNEAVNKKLHCAEEFQPLVKNNFASAQAVQLYYEITTEI